MEMSHLSELKRCRVATFCHLHVKLFFLIFFLATAEILDLRSSLVGSRSTSKAFLFPLCFLATRLYYCFPCLPPPSFRSTISMNSLDSAASADSSTVMSTPVGSVTPTTVPTTIPATSFTNSSQTPKTKRDSGYSTMQSGLSGSSSQA